MNKKTLNFIFVIIFMTLTLFSLYGYDTHIQQTIYLVYLALILYSIGLNFLFKYILDEHQPNNYYKHWRFWEKFYSEIGYGLFVGGLVALITTTETITAWSLILIGFSGIVLGSIYENKIEKLKELIEESSRKKKSKHF